MKNSRLPGAGFVALTILTLAGCGLQPTATTGPIAFELVFDTTQQAEPYSGRVYVMLSENLEREPRSARGWVNPPPLFARDVEAWDPEKPVVVDRSALFHPVALDSLPAGEYRIQAVARRSLDDAVAGQGAGDLYSEPVNVYLDPDSTTVVRLLLDQVVEEAPFVETERVKLVTFESPALSAFHGRPYTMHAGVALPRNWEDRPDAAYPVLYSVTGFGGSHRSIHRLLENLGERADDVILVVPDATNYLGHSVFADSDNTGPWGEALVDELIPHLEALYHGAGPEQRYVTGVSSGGWSSLWLQITYPDAFSGVWSMVPDPIDFRDFQRINLYAENANMYTDERGERRPLARRDGEVMIWYDDFVHMEDVMGPGGQIQSFEAVFGPKGPDGRPVPLFDRKTGAVNQETARTWERYDINLILSRNWDTLGPKLEGKLHIYAGEFDTFYLEGAVRLLKETLQNLGSDAVVEIMPGRTHEMIPEGLDDLFATVEERAGVVEVAN